MHSKAELILWPFHVVNVFLVDPQELLEEILDAEDTCDEERLEGLFCGAVKYLHGNRSKPDPAVYLTLMYLAKTKASMFNSDVIIQVGFCADTVQNHLYKYSIWF